jgi:hypothetical protein
VTRPGLRFWKYDSVKELLAKRLASLSEIEKLVAKAQDAQKSGQNDPDLWFKVTFSPKEVEDLEQWKAQEPLFFKSFRLYGDYSLKQLAAQGPELLKRVADAKQIYENLRRVAERERLVRTQK